jgi:hypothetical protein
MTEIRQTTKPVVIKLEDSNPLLQKSHDGSKKTQMLFTSARRLAT